MITRRMYVAGALLLAVGEAIALAKITPGEEPITFYVRGLLRFGPAGFLFLLLVWLWLGWHFLIDRDGTRPF